MTEPNPRTLTSQEEEEEFLIGFLGRLRELAAAPPFQALLVAGGADAVTEPLARLLLARAAAPAVRVAALRALEGLALALPRPALAGAFHPVRRRLQGALDDPKRGVRRQAGATLRRWRAAGEAAP